MLSDVQASRHALTAAPCIGLGEQCFRLASPSTEHFTALLRESRLDLWHRSFYSGALAVRNGPKQTQSKAKTKQPRALSDSQSTEDTP